MKVGHRKTGDRQHFPMERFVDVLTNVKFDSIDAFAMGLRRLWVSYHAWIIAYQNTCSLLQTYHLAVTPNV